MLAGFEVNENAGDELRRALYEKTGRVLDCLSRPGHAHAQPVRASRSSRSPSATTDDIGAVGRFLFENGIYVTLAAYPLVPKDEVGFRVQVTAANTDDQIDELIDTLGALADRFALQRSDPLEEAA